MGFHKSEIEKCFRQKSYYERVVDHLPAATTLSKFDEAGKKYIFTILRAKTFESNTVQQASSKDKI